jgi:hypothetical protein
MPSREFRKAAYRAQHEESEDQESVGQDALCLFCAFIVRRGSISPRFLMFGKPSMWPCDR